MDDVRLQNNQHLQWFDFSLETVRNAEFNGEREGVPPELRKSYVLQLQNALCFYPNCWHYLPLSTSSFIRVIN